MDMNTGHPRRRPILAVLCLSLLVVVIDNTIRNTALPTLARVLRASTTDLRWSQAPPSNGHRPVPPALSVAPAAVNRSSEQLS